MRRQVERQTGRMSAEVTLTPEVANGSGTAFQPCLSKVKTNLSRERAPVDDRNGNSPVGKRSRPHVRLFVMCHSARRTAKRVLMDGQHFVVD